MTRVARAAASLITGAALLTACTHGGGAPRPPVVETHLLTRLNTAIAAVNAARRQLAADASAIGTAAQRVDAVDDVAVDGDRAAVRERRPAAGTAVAAGGFAARRYNADVALYRRAAGALDAAKAEGLDAAQQRAVAGVVAAARRELVALHAYAIEVAIIWPEYEQLDAAQKLWLARASNGWYRDQHESAGAYVVLTDRAALAAARRTLAAADRDRLAAAQECDAAVATARTALASLVG